MRVPSYYSAQPTLCVLIDWRPRFYWDTCTTPNTHPTVVAWTNPCLANLMHLLCTTSTQALWMRTTR